MNTYNRKSFSKFLICQGDVNNININWNNINKTNQPKKKKKPSFIINWVYLKTLPHSKRGGAERLL